MRKIIFLLFIFCLLHTLEAQLIEKQCFKVICYNVENYFDCIDDTLTNDSEYIPGGMRGWNNEKYKKKQAGIAKVITAIGGWDAPALVGLCEIESEKCMRDLTRYSGLSALKYNYIHHESPDARGVDVALLYQPKMFKPLHDEPIHIHYPMSSTTTRDILYTSGIVPTGDTLHVFVCHFPSRLGGELESVDKREFVASVLKAKVDSIFASVKYPNILIMGDFNDYPTNNSMLKVLKALPPENNASKNELFNLMFPLHIAGIGSHKHEGEWGTLDQIIVSGNLMQIDAKFTTKLNDTHIFDADFLLENDSKYLGSQPFRTYVGMKYQGGFADHLPVYIDFWY